MNTQLENDEKDFVRDLLAWEQRRRPLEWLLSNLALVLGGVVILVTIVYTLRHLTDRLVFWVTIPGFLLGAVFVGVYYWGSKRIKERHRVAIILKKLMA